MKRLMIFPLLFALVLTGCSSKKQEATLSPEDRTDLYETAIEAARDEETNQSLPLVDDADDEMATLIFELLGIAPGDMTSYALSVSLMNVKAYAIAAIYPAAGKEDVILDALRAFVDSQVQSFQQYLADQYEIAVNTRLETLEDGTVLLVMCADQDAVFDAIRDVIERGK